MVPKKSFRGLIVFFLSMALTMVVGQAKANDRIVFGTNWLPQCEHGGFYQALATGLYTKAGLDVVIRSGGPQISTTQLLAGGALDIALLGGSNQLFSFVEQDAPFVAVAAFFQKDPTVLISHVGVGNDRLADFKGKPIMIAKDSWTGFWPFLKQKYGFTDDQIRAYNFDSRPFLMDPRAIIQGYITNDPFTMKDAKISANFILLADHGFSGYSHLLATSRNMIVQRPDVVRRFIAASVAGWKAYLGGDSAPADALIFQRNPDYSPTHAVACREAILSAHLMDSGDAVTQGMGAMTDARWHDFASTAIAAGIYPPDFNWRAAFTTQFVNKRAD